MRQVALNPPFKDIRRVHSTTVQQDVRSSYDRAARCLQYDCAARYIPHTKTAVMLVIYYHSLSMESKYTDQDYLDLCLFIPAVKNTGMPNSPRDTTEDAKST